MMYNIIKDKPITACKGKGDIMLRYVFQYGSIFLREGKIITRTIKGKKIEFFKMADKQEIPLYKTKESLTDEEQKRFNGFQKRLEHDAMILDKIKNGEI